ncbi:carboxypeptidase B-like [Brachionus plicatilis]|uniref:Carboxypeptidase B-like n=1 Tax=Brachionus plicatilis TaxID=10195 RepID=A0A3M7P256_BRAPC|nr:carboxypeptidase B-like [Brachionus plicatilis]
MNFNLALCVAVLLFGTLALAEKTRYDNYKLVNLKPKTPLQIHLITEWEEKADFDVWTRIKTVEESVNVLLSPQAFVKYSVMFKIFKIPAQIMEENMQRNVDEQERSMALTRNSKNIVGRYARYTEIQSFIDNLAATYPSLVSSKIAGRTYENRNLKVAIIKTSTSTRKVWIDCGIHAREWVTPATCVWIINKLVTGYNSGDSLARELLGYFEFHILPLVNPDGYEYTHTTTRLWRKNRNPNSGSSCIGTDLNRNYGFKWLTGGSSTNPCSDVYAGRSGDSELETQAVENYIKQYPGQWDSFLTIHSYGKWWFTPYGYTQTLPSDFTELNNKAKIGLAGISASGDGSGWISGSSSRILYIASGGSEDWAYGTAGIKYSYCLELRPGQSGTDSFYGFTLPEDRAPKAGEETYGGITAFLKSIKA